MFKAGDKVVCINIEYDKRSEPCPLILYRTYTINHMIGGTTGLAILINHKNTAFGSYRFIHLIEYRKQKLQKICTRLGIV